MDKIKQKDTFSYVEKKEEVGTAKVKSSIEKDEQQPTTIKAYKFINHLRRESILEEKSNEKPKRFSKETEVIKIGQSLQTKIAKVMKPETSKGQESNDSQEKEESHATNNLNGRVDPEYLPTNLTKLTSVELIALLKNSIIYDKNDIVALQKPYGLA